MLPLVPADETLATTLIASMWRDVRSPRRRNLGVILGLCLHGLRTAEIRFARRDDLHATGRLYVRTVKRGPRRLLTLDAEFAWSLRTFRRADSPWLLPSERGTQMSKANLTRRISNWLLRNVGPYSAHSLRHTAALRVYAATGDVLAVQHLLGHRHLESTMTYLRAWQPVEDVLLWPRRFSQQPLAVHTAAGTTNYYERVVDLRDGTPLVPRPGRPRRGLVPKFPARLLPLTPEPTP